MTVLVVPCLSPESFGFPRGAAMTTSCGSYFSADGAAFLTRSGFSNLEWYLREILLLFRKGGFVSRNAST